MAATTIPLGAYINQPDNSNAASMVSYAAKYASFTQLMGTAPQFLDYFLNEAEPFSGWAGNAQWAATSAAQSAARFATPVIAMPLTSTRSTLSADGQYKAFASGQYDDMIQAMVKAWAQQGFTTQYWRPGWEMNVASMPSYAGTDAQTQADWVAAFRHVSTVLHAAGAAQGVDVQVIWNPNVTNYDALGVLKNLYPGNAYVDVIGADMYADAYPFSDGNNAAGQATYHDWTTGAELTSLSDWLSNPANLSHYWSNPAATRWSLDGSNGHNLSLATLLDFARAQGKPFAVPETGAGNASGGHDVADDAAFPAWLAQTLQASSNTIRFVNLWDSNGGGNFAFSSSADGKPAEAAAWARWFGAQSTSSGSTSAKLDTLLLRVSEDAYAGNAQFTVSVDGVQVGGVQTATASHAAGASQGFEIKGSFGTRAHAVDVRFLNDAYGGPGLDRNLYVDALSYNGVAVSNAAAALYGNGSVQEIVPYSGSFTPDTLTVSVSEDAWKGDAQFLVTMDGQAVGGVRTATASHAAGASQAFEIKGSFGTGTHTVGITFLNDAYGGPGLDRNLYVNAVSYNGIAVPGAAASLYGNGSVQEIVPAVAQITPDTLTLNVSEDAWMGDAQFLVTMDGQALGGVQTATASHALGKTATVTFSGSFGSGAHTVGVSFLNDAYGGVGRDRNLYVDAMTFNGKAVAGGASTFSWNDAHFTAVPASAAGTVMTAGTSSPTITLVSG